MDAHPRLVKPALVSGTNLTFRDACMSDAQFIVSLRTDPVRGRFLSPTSEAISAQEQWLAAYAQNGAQVYFIIEADGCRVGTVRLYDARANSFCWGSWILTASAPPFAAIESALIIYSFAVDQLGFTAAHFDVRRENEKVWQFHERFGAVRVGATPLDFLYELSLDAIRKSMHRYRRYLPEPVRVEWQTGGEHACR
jgi:RimJ/RimL family protein N-acetyltransferase